MMTLEEFRKKYHYAQSTKMIQQYLDVKFANLDCLLLFRMGDFYEMFFEDAVVARKEQYEMIELWNECSSEK